MRYVRDATHVLQFNSLNKIGTDLLTLSLAILPEASKMAFVNSWILFNVMPHIFCPSNILKKWKSSDLRSELLGTQFCSVHFCLVPRLKILFPKLSLIRSSGAPCSWKCWFRPSYIPLIHGEDNGPRWLWLDADFHQGRTIAYDTLINSPLPRLWPSDHASPFGTLRRALLTPNNTVFMFV